MIKKKSINVSVSTTVDEDWKRPQIHFTDYTKLPGGNYTFHLKASDDRTEWNCSENMINIHIATVLNKTVLIIY